MLVLCEKLSVRLGKPKFSKFRHLRSWVVRDSETKEIVFGPTTRKRADAWRLEQEKKNETKEGNTFVV